MKREQVLVIEENPATAHEIVSLCFKMGYEPLLACDGFNGMLLALRVKPRVIISDVETPGLDGFEIVRRIRSHHELDGSAVVGVSRVAPRKPAANQIGFDDCVLKPVSSTELAAVLNKLCENPERELAPAV